MGHLRLTVYAFVIINVVLLACVAIVRTSPSPMAPRVNVRWTAELTDAERKDVEQKFRLLDGEQRDTSTWAYDLGDPAPATVKALVSHPAIEDTHYIDRAAGTVSGDAPRGKTMLIQSGPSAWRDSRVVEWLGLFGLSSVVVSLIWLFTEGSHRAS